MATIYRLTHRYLYDQEADDCYVKTSMPVNEVLEVFLHLHQIGETLPEFYRHTESINPIELAMASEKLFNFTRCEETDADIVFDIYSELEGNRLLYKTHSVTFVPDHLVVQTVSHSAILKDIYSQTRNERNRLKKC